MQRKLLWLPEIHVVMIIYQLTSIKTSQEKYTCPDTERKDELSQFHPDSALMHCLFRDRSNPIQNKTCRKAWCLTCLELESLSLAICRHQFSWGCSNKRLGLLPCSDIYDTLYGRGTEQLRKILSLLSTDIRCRLLPTELKYGSLNEASNEIHRSFIFCTLIKKSTWF